MKVKSIAECSLGAFCNTFDLHYAKIALENPIFRRLFEWPLNRGFAVYFYMYNIQLHGFGVYLLQPSVNVTDQS